jgi:hypothetical protein
VSATVSEIQLSKQRGQRKYPLESTISATYFTGHEHAAHRPLDGLCRVAAAASSDGAIASNTDASSALGAVQLFRQRNGIFVQRRTSVRFGRNTGIPTTVEEVFHADCRIAARVA